MAETPYLPQQATTRTIALPGSSLFDVVRQKLLDDLGQVQVERRGQERIYRPRAEMLAEVVTADTWIMMLDWLSSTRRSSVNTKRAYADDIRRVWAAYAQELGHERFALGIFTRDHIRAWRIREEAKGTPLTTIARYLRALSSLHVYASERIDLPRNPVTQDDTPRIENGNTSRSTPVLEVAEIQAVIAEAKDEFDLLVVTLLYALAGRIGEMCAADVTDRVERGRRSYLDVTRKENKERLLPLPLSVAELLDKHTEGRESGPLLLDSEGRRLDRHDVGRMLARMGRKAGVLPERKLTPHVLRASRITHMLDDGVPLAEVQAFADHDNPGTTIGYWDRRNKGQRNAAHVDAAEAVFADVVPKFRR
ncbi:tyrosine-type recombinase/integrase [Streptomyces sp. NBC_01233]|uniref:tyrosine-type recombinase/integrase n=1 Tax=Streptomyces sp. NBC_01233 TaxID=2903787 RepID=UPI002E0EB1BB|nr:tyrosine-type recombinase/integrase [Streptomyces sp. NBC_01233]